MSMVDEATSKGGRIASNEAMAAVGGLVVGGKVTDGKVDDNVAQAEAG